MALWYVGARAWWFLEHHNVFSKKIKTELVVKMHRAYQPITPANNKLLKKRWDQRSYDLHRSKVGRRRMRPGSFALVPFSSQFLGAYIPSGNR